MKEIIFVNIFMHPKNKKIQKKMQHDIIVYQTWLLTMNVWENILHII